MFHVPAMPNADAAYLAFFATKKPPILVDQEDAERPGSPGARLVWAATVGADRMVKAAGDAREAEGVEPVVVVASWESKAGRQILMRLYGPAAGELFEGFAGVMVRAFTEGELPGLLGPELAQKSLAELGAAGGAQGGALRVLFAVTGAALDARVLRPASGEEVLEAIHAAQPKPASPKAAEPPPLPVAPASPTEEPQPSVPAEAAPAPMPNPLQAPIVQSVGQTGGVTAAVVNNG